MVLLGYPESWNLTYKFPKKTGFENLKGKYLVVSLEMVAKMCKVFLKILTPILRFIHLSEDGNSWFLCWHGGGGRERQLLLSKNGEIQDSNLSRGICHASSPFVFVYPKVETKSRSLNCALAVRTTQSSQIKQVNRCLFFSTLSVPPSNNRQPGNVVPFNSLGRHVVWGVPSTALPSFLTELRKAIFPIRRRRGKSEQEKVHSDCAVCDCLNLRSRNSRSRVGWGSPLRPCTIGGGGGGGGASSSVLGRDVWGSPRQPFRLEQRRAGRQLGGKIGATTAGDLRGLSLLFLSCLVPKASNELFPLKGGRGGGGYPQ